MSDSPSNPHLLAGRLCLDFVNSTPTPLSLSWEDLIRFLEVSRVVSAERGTQLLALPQSDSQAAEGLLLKARQLCSSLRKVFVVIHRKLKITAEWVESLNDILRITEGHDELLCDNGTWRIEFIAREGGLDWLLAAVARSAAELIAEGPGARLRLCANPRCGLFFYDNSRTHRRRWCSMAVCGNRNKVAAFARKHSSPPHS